MAHQGLQQVQRLAQVQILAPQLQQSLQILQVPLLELRQMVLQELQTNPTLEERPVDNVNLEIEPGVTEAPEKEKAKESEDEFQREFEQLAQLDDEWREYFSQAGAVRSYSSDDEERRKFFFDSIVKQETLQEHLLSQLQMSDLGAADRRIGELIIGSIDDSGYLTTSLMDLSLGSGLEVGDLEGGLRVVQAFDPVGVGSRDLRECLLVQLDRLGKSGSLAARIVAGHIESLGKKRYPEIARALSVTVAQVQQAANLIATLEPKPGRIFGAEPDHYVVPDVVVRKVDDEYVVILNDEQVPHLRISREYRRLMSEEDGDPKTKEYVRDKIRSGKFLIKSIYQRQRTIENIAREIVLHQRDFLDRGVGYLKPLTMARIAERVGVHETTVSRAIANKYMETPQGIFEMKFFFSPGYTTDSGQEMSNVAVKETIADLVAREDTTHPLSDQEVVEILKEQGVSIARRTVAKYRQELNILPSNLRRQY